MIAHAAAPSALPPGFFVRRTFCRASSAHSNALEVASRVGRSRLETMPVMDGVPCLDEELIAAFVVGSLNASQRVRVEEHLAECDACLSVVSAAAYGCVGGTTTLVASGDEWPESGWAPVARLEAESHASRDRALAEFHHELLDGALPGRFRLLNLLGRGSVGTVWRAYDGVRGHTVALKVLHGVAGRERARLKAEFRALASLSHPHLVTLHELVINEQASFISMELVRGLDLLTFHRSRCDAAGHVDVVRLGETAGQLALALEHLHRAGQLHRDVKPSSVLVTEQGRVVLLDLGPVWPLADPERARAVAPAGARGYVAPEQQQGRALTPAADWYAFGRTLQHTITADLPASEPCSIEERVPAALRELISRLLEPSPEARPGADEILRCLGVAQPARVIPGTG
jgi:hypothetical protein